MILEFWLVLENTYYVLNNVEQHVSLVLLVQRGRVRNNFEQHVSLVQWILFRASGRLLQVQIAAA